MSTDAKHYAVSIKLRPRSTSESAQFVEVGSSTTVTEVLDNVYFMLKGEVGAYTY
jgi:hypothetical protein